MDATLTPEPQCSAAILVIDYYMCWASMLLPTFKAGPPAARRMHADINRSGDVKDNSVTFNNLNPSFPDCRG